MKELEKTNEVLTAAIDKLTKLITPNGHVSESIFSCKSTIIPMADVQHIEKNYQSCDLVDGSKKGDLSGIMIITKNTRWDMEADTWANNIWLAKEEAERFIKAWCVYRHELEKDTLNLPT